MAAARPSWIVFGGVGFIGRSFVKYLIDNNLATDIRVADKRLPFMAFLSPDHKASFENPIVECVQVDVSDDDMLDRAFSESRSGSKWTYVVNCAAETAHGKSDEFYQKGVDGARKIAERCVAHGVQKLVHVSSASVYASSSKPCGEGAKLAPWTRQADFMLKSEEAVRSVARAPFVIVRPTTVYGPGDVAGVMPRAVIACTYVEMKEKLQFLWDGDLKCNTVHVFDVARALFFLARKGETGGVYNLSDKGNTDQARLAAALAAVFRIDVGFVGSMKSTLASAAMDAVLDAVNEKHLAPWTALLKKHGVRNTPLSPFLHRQLLAHNHLCVDGGAVEALGFKYLVPELTADAIRDAVALHIAQGIFPPLLPS